MARETATVMGSGTVPYTVSTLHTTLGGTYAGQLASGPGPGRGVRDGTQVIVANPEDINSAPAFRCSGIAVGITPINISNQISRSNLLKRSTRVLIQNLGSGNLFIGSTNQVSAALAGGEPGWELIAPTAGQVPPQGMLLPVMDGVDIWAVASATTDVRMLFY